MKNYLILGLAICSVTLLGSCKSKESAYRQAYEKAKAMQPATDDVTTVAVTPVTTPNNNTNTQETVEVIPVTTTTTTVVAEDNSDVRTIEGGITVVNGENLLTYSIVVGSFVTQANAEGLMSTLRNKGYDARVVKTNEVINGHTGWFRVIASSFNNKAAAAQSRDNLKATYPGAWLLYNK